ncbi:MAG: HEAT repeat domain-containing protein [Planctomycetota bacterium]
MLPRNGLGGLLALALLFPIPGLAAQDANEDAARAIQEKRAHLTRVIEELSTRDLSQWTAEQRAARLENLERLAAYRDRGEFPKNIDFPDRRVPYFVDGDGTRCAMAHLLDLSGGEELVERLAQEANHAYVAEIPDDPELLEWIPRLGLTLDEVAFIQGPSRGRWTENFNPVDTPNSFPAPQPSDTPGRGDRTPPPHAGPGTGAGRPIPAATPSAPAATPGGAAAGANTRRARVVNAGASWETWWRLNRDLLVNLRERYHVEHGAITPRSADSETHSPWRPTAEEIASLVVPALKEIAIQDDDLSIDALVALATTEFGQTDPWLPEAIARFVSKSSRQHRDFALLALGIARNTHGLPLLRDIVSGGAAGRLALGEPSRVPDHLRALAAISLGRVGTDGDEKLLQNALTRADGNADLQSACVAGLGLLAERVAGRREVVFALIQTLESDKLPTQVRAHVPAALARSGEPAALDHLQAWIANFRGPQEIRRACTLALAESSPGLNETLAAVLIAQARRDPDAAGRQFAIVTLGRLSDRHPLADTDENKELRRRLAIFFTDGVQGEFHQPADVPWLAVSAAMFGRRHAEYKTAIRNRLVALTDGAVAQDRSAAVLGLGLLEDPTAKGVLRGVIDEAKSPSLVGYAAESLGLSEDSTVGDRLLELCLGSSSDQVRHQAALGLGSVANRRLVPTLMKELAASKSEPVRSALGQALGQIGDRRALPFLVSWSKDPSKDLASRRRAVGALGRLIEEGDRSWTLDLRQGADFTSASSSLQMLLALD